jgi:GTP:adenosylcobinamide-phosphate guanylyltransferase
VSLQIIITAGGELPADMQGAGHAPNKSLLRVDGGTLLARALAAAETLPRRGEIAVVGDEHVRSALPAGTLHVPSGGSVVDNLHRGFERLGGKAHDYLVLSSDLPFITAVALTRFVEAAQAAAELAAPLITREHFLQRFPGAPNRFERLDGREVTMGSAFYFTGPLLQANVPLMRDFARFRKSPGKLAMLLGWEVLWGFIIRRVRLAALERRASLLTGGTVRAVELDAAELAYDIDTLPEYDYAVAHAGRVGAPRR